MSDNLILIIGLFCTALTILGAIMTIQEFKKQDENGWRFAFERFKLIFDLGATLKGGFFLSKAELAVFVGDTVFN